MFPNDSITLYEEIVGITTTDLVNDNDDKTILAITFQQSKDLSDTVLYCGNDILAKNYGKDFGQTYTNYQCSDNITISKTGNDEASVIITYVPYFTSNFSTTTQYGYNPSNNIASSSDIQVFGSFSAGEIMIAFLLSMQIFLMLLTSLISSFNRIRTGKKYIEYSNGDVPISDNL